MSWDFDSFNESGFDGFIDSGFDARGGSMARLWKINPADGTTIWAADWPEHDGSIDFVFVTSTRVYAVLQAGASSVLVKVLSADGIPISTNTYSIPSDKWISYSIMPHVPTGHFVWLHTEGFGQFKTWVCRMNPDTGGFAANVLTPLATQPLRYTATNSGDLVSLNTLAFFPPYNSRQVINASTGALSFPNGPFNAADFVWRDTSQVRTPLISGASNGVPFNNVIDGVLTYSGYDAGPYYGSVSLYGQQLQVGNQAVPATSQNASYAAATISFKTKVRKIGGWLALASDSTVAPTLAASGDGVFVGTGYSRSGVAYSRLEMLKESDGSKLWTKDFASIATPPFAMSIGPDGMLYCATQRAPS